MRAAEVIELATSELTAPIVFAQKKNGSLRLCIDYRRLNEAKLKESYPITCMEECIYILGDAQIFSTLDANCDYW